MAGIVALMPTALTVRWAGVKQHGENHPSNHREVWRIMENILLIMIGSISAIAIILCILLTTKIISDDSNNKKS